MIPMAPILLHGSLLRGTASWLWSVGMRTTRGSGAAMSLETQATPSLEDRGAKTWIPAYRPQTAFQPSQDHDPVRYISIF